MIWTIGHSTRPFDAFARVLAVHDIELIVDVRRLPGSRRLPQYDSATLAANLDARRVAYAWLPALGGRRRPAAGSPNTGWRNPSFQAYADHIATEEFASGLFDLLLMAEALRTAIMCAEILWWRCHRRLIADVLTSLGMPVLHIRDESAATPHRLTDPARIVNGRLTYAAAASVSRRSARVTRQS